jgi:phosphatidylethanolamine/phosphatidyl-N-methylethanolamine N-methyltransferase
MNHTLESIKDRFVEDFRFFRGWIKKPGEVGSVKPTGKEAARLMASFIPLDSDLPVLELGPGTGVITQAILDRGVAPEKLVSIEYSLDFYKYLVPRFPGVHFIHGDAFEAEKLLAGTQFTKFSAIISAVPLLNISKPSRIELVSTSLNRIANHGPYVQISYGPRAPTPAISGVYKVEASDWVMKNVPPARVFVYRRDTNPV